MKRLACLYKVCTKLDFKQLFLFRLDWRPVTEESQLNAWARAGKQIKLFMFLFLCFLVWPYNKHLLNRARSVCTGESWPRSLVQTSLCSFCTGNLGKDSPIKTSCSVINTAWNVPYRSVPATHLSSDGWYQKTNEHNSTQIILEERAILKKKTWLTARPLRSLSGQLSRRHFAKMPGAC